MSNYDFERTFIDILSKAKDSDEIEMIKEQLLCDVEAEIDMAFEWVMEKNNLHYKESEAE